MLTQSGPGRIVRGRMERLSGRKNHQVSEMKRCALGRIRTCDTGFRRAVLYPLSYEGRLLELTASQSLASFHSTGDSQIDQQHIQ